MSTETSTNTAIKKATRIAERLDGEVTISSAIKEHQGTTLHSQTPSMVGSMVEKCPISHANDAQDKDGEHSLLSILTYTFKIQSG